MVLWTDNGLRDEPQSAGGGNCVFLQFTVPADRAQRSPKLISQPDRADGRRPSELQRAVRPIVAGHLAQGVL